MISLTAWLKMTGPVMVIALLSGCRETPVAAVPQESQLPELTLLALGDSYTVGQGVPPQASWPRQLADSLATGGDTLRVMDLVAGTGWTTRDLLEALRQEQATGDLQTEPYGLVTLMIGVNNQFQGVDLAVFQAEMDTLITTALALAGDRAQGVLGFSIPDYGVTPLGQLFDPELISEEIQAHNQVLQQKYADSGIHMLDVTAISLAAADDPRLVARDNLHFSEEMYRRWVSLMLPSVRSGLALNP